MILEAKDVSFYYEKDKYLFKDVNIAINQNEIVGIYGYSGCGKTSFSKILSNYLKPVKGEVTLDGEKFNLNEFCKVQLIFQHPERVMNPNWKMKRVLHESYIPDSEILEKFGIREEWMDRYPQELSGGELQRFSIVRSLHPDVKFIIADEMTTMLDSITQAFCWKQLLSIVKERGLGLIIISHDKSLLEKICTKIIYFDFM